MHLFLKAGNVPAMDTKTHALPSQGRLMDEARARRAKALALRRAGKNNREIGEIMGGLSPERARQLVAKAIKDEGGR